LKTFLVWVFSFFWASTIAQQLNLSFNHLTREGGLSNNNTLSFLPDSRGFLWIGTHNGLNRFDGSNCLSFKPYNSTIKGVYIANLLEDKNGDLWFTSETGLNHYSRKNNTFENFECLNDGKPHQYLPFYIDDRNNVWFTVVGKGIFTLNPADKSTQLISKQSSNYIKVQSKFFQEVKNIFYSENDGGLSHLSLQKGKITKKNTFFDGKTQPTLKLARYFFIENDSLVWLTGNQLGLIKLNFQNAKFKIFNTNNKKKNDFFTSIAFHQNSHRLFLGSNMSGVMVFDSKSEKFVQQFEHDPNSPKSIKSNWVEDIVIDKNQNIFINLMGWGIDYTNLNTSNSEHWFSKNEARNLKFKDNVIASSFIHKNKILIKLQQGEIIVLDTKGHFIRQIKDYPAADNLFYGADSTLFACGLGEVLVLDDDFRVKQRIPIKTKAGEPMQALFGAVISPNELIISAMAGLFSIKKEGKSYFSNPIEEINSEEFQVNQPLYYDKNTQQIFFSSNWWNRICVFKKIGQLWKQQNISKINASIFNIVPDKNDTQKLWFCTNKGLWKFDTKSQKYEIWDEAKGLPDNSVTTYIPEKNGDFWLITNRGISFYNKKLGTFKNFSEKDGATASEYDWYGNFRLPDGRMSFSGTDGITVIDPEQINSNAIAELYFTDIKVKEKSLLTDTYIGENNAIRLKPNESSFSIDFVGIEYNNPENTKLQYQLKGIDNQWITTKNPATIHFSNIPEGTYELMIRSININGEVSSEKSLKVVVEAPFWRTMWFRIIVLMAILGLIYAFYRYRINELLKMQAVRNRISSDLHDEIGATLSGIGILSTVAKQQLDENHPSQALLSRITEDALTVGNSIDDIVWSINPKNDELTSIIARMNRHAAELFDAKNIDYQILIPDTIENIKLSMEQRRNVYLIFKEAINNLIKYASCSHVLIEIKFTNRKFTLFIKDDGKGFDIEKPSNRNGLKNIKNRAKNLNGMIKIVSKLGEGTSIFLEFMV
jgi:ligand-binding sensor domain-containing protein